MILVIFRNLTILLDPVIIVMLPNLVILKNMRVFVNKGISGYSKESFDFGESGGANKSGGYGDSCSLNDSGNCKEVYDFGESDGSGDYRWF